jgi:septal ring factor EnvC (AmiA/AmiB activator)
MKQSSRQFTYAAARAFAAAVLVGAIAFPPSPVLAAKDSSEDRAEARIKDIHAKLKITPTQEDQWAKITQEMRNHAKSMDALTQERFAKAKTMTAVEDLKSYGEIADAHAHGLKNFASLFEALYASMSDEQKKEADALFRKGDRGRSRNK